MTATADAQAPRAPFRLDGRELAIVLGLITALRVAGLMLSPLNLHGDEAQYWAWSRTLDWGYFSKPPLIAWTISATTALFGNDEWAVRLAAPLAHGAAAWVLFLLGRRAYGHAAGVWAALGWALMPGVWLSAGIISTDALLLPIWAVALYCAWRLQESADRRWALALGAAIGAGLLAKYAMLYFFAGLALAISFSPRMRAAFWSARGALAAIVAAIVAAPNLIWNALNGFATIAHTAANADLGGHWFNPDDFADFFVAQFGVLGPLLFGALLFLIWRAARRPSALSEADRFFLAFVLPPLAIIGLQALLSRAHGNWAATAYPAAVVLIAGRLASGPGVRLLQASAVLHLVLGVLWMAAALSPSFADRLGLGNALKRTRGWEATAARIAEYAAAAPYTAILVDNRLLFYELNYYWRDARPAAPLRMWPLHDAPGNEAEAVASLKPEEGARVLAAIGTPDYAPLIADDFLTFRQLRHEAFTLGGGRLRELQFAVGRVYQRAPRDEAFYERRAALRED